MLKLSCDTPLTDWPRVNRKIWPALKHLGIRTIRDLLFYFPARYDDFSNLKNISDVEIGETVTICGRVEKIKNNYIGGRIRVFTDALIKDDTGSIKAVWYNQPFLIKNLQVGDIVNLAGKVALNKSGKHLQNPAHEKVTSDKRHVTGLNSIHTGGLVAIYPETRGITSRWLRFLIKNAIDLRHTMFDPLPKEVIKKYGLPEIRQAVFSIHFPKNIAEAETARRRFDFEELFYLQMHALMERSRLKQNSAPAIKTDLNLLKSFAQSLPYTLTDAQRRSIWEIARDMERPHPMNRLLEGDVGSGKTVVAAAASLLAVKQGLKVAFMAPTEILARQHYETLRQVLQPYAIKVGLLVGSEKKITGNSEILVGTHALIQKNVKIKNLGLIIVDEQHRFGVEQRALLQRQETSDKQQGNALENSMSHVTCHMSLPHFLSMSATPIPRTLALTIYGDLDVSVLDEMPKSRLKIITKIIEPKQRPRAYDFIRQEVSAGRQTFVICPRIELSDNDKKPAGNNYSQQKLLLWEVKAVTEEYKKLSQEIFPDLKVGMLHGKMKAKEKTKIMSDFKNKKTDILVSTSVIEVGVDIPNATIMLIEGAERFGLAQLHQFRGRVGRGEHQAYCFLFPTENGLSTSRLRAMEETQNGFELAEKDLQIRGPGDFFGHRQSGEISSALMLATKNPRLVQDIKAEVLAVARRSPDLKLYPELRQKMQELEKIIHLE